MEQIQSCFGTIWGEVWLEAGIAEEVAHVHEIHEQYGRREVGATQVLVCGGKGSEAWE